MSDKPSHIDPVEGHKPPSKLRETPKQALPKPRKRKKVHTEASQYAYQQTLPKKERGDIKFDKDSPFHPDYFNDDKQQPQKIKERIMKALLNQLLAFFKTWLYGRPVYKTKVNNVSGEIEFVIVDGKKVMNYPLTIMGRVMQLLGAVGLLTSVVWGKTVAEWGDIIKSILALLA